MLSSRSVIVDLSTLNVLFKSDEKFTMALNFGGSLGRLGSVLASFGPGYDVYLCLRPRQEGEGNFVVQQLSLSAVPFVVDVGELFQVLKYFRTCVGVNEVYLCNWLNNFVEESRTDTFDSAFYYGARVAKVSVKEKLVTDFRIYQDVREFGNEHGDDFDGYGDLGLLDVDGFKAQYPEFLGASKAQVMTLAPLAHCLLTQCVVNIEEIYDTVEKIATNGAPVEEEPEPEPESAVEEPGPLSDLEYEPDPPKIKEKVGTPFSAIIMSMVAMALAACIGFSVYFVRNGRIDDKSAEYYASLDSRVIGLQQVAEVYRGTTTATFDTVGVYDFVQKSGLEVTVVGFERYPTQYIVRCNCASEDVFNSYLEYLGQSYVLIDTNDLGMVEVGEGHLRQFSATFN